MSDAYTEQDRHNEGCCWTWPRDHCPGSRCICVCHVGERVAQSPTPSVTEIDTLQRAQNDIVALVTRIASLEAERDELTANSLRLIDDNAMWRRGYENWKQGAETLRAERDAARDWSARWKRCASGYRRDCIGLLVPLATLQGAYNEASFERDALRAAITEALAEYDQLRPESGMAVLEGVMMRTPVNSKDGGEGLALAMLADGA